MLCEESKRQIYTSRLLTVFSRRGVNVNIDCPSLSIIPNPLNFYRYRIERNIDYKEDDSHVTYMKKVE